LPRNETGGAAWTLGTVASILANPRYTGRQVWNRQRTDSDLVDPGNTGLGHKPVARWNLPAGWVISARPAHPALVSEADYIAAQDASAPRGPAGPATRRYLLAGLLRCGTCGRRLESAWSNGKPAYRCRHGYTSATKPNPARPENLHIREDQILPRLAALAILHASHGQGPTRKRCGPQVTAPGQAADLIQQLRTAGVSLIYDPATKALRIDTVTVSACYTPAHRVHGKERQPADISTRHGQRQPRVTFPHARTPAHMGNYCVRGGLEHATAGNFPGTGKVIPPR
jgi:hypothetical protein